MPGSKVGPSGTAPQLSPRAARAPKSASAALRRRYSVLGRTEAGDEGFEVVRVGGRADHLGMIDILRRDEQLGVHLARLQAAGGQIGGELNQARLSRSSRSASASAVVASSSCPIAVAP
jgi:hypothetical protein